ncbi:MAG: hypothetical protein KDD14_23430 [Saprospiraceae bacterium]|nr:hypothetical protein [Saprospiraceae bacterium]
MNPVAFQPGKKTTIYLPNGEQRQGQFAVVDLAAIKASHDEQTFADTPGYPRNPGGSNINDRNYAGDPNAQALVDEYARKLEPGLLISTGRTPEGTPVISPEGFVVSGNNRTMSAKLARAKYPARYQAYRDFLQEELSAFGISEKDFADRTLFAGGAGQIAAPFLVRIDYDIPALSTQELAKYNQTSTKSERPVDKTIKLSNILRENASCSQQIPKLFEDDETMSEFYADTNAQKQLLDMLLTCNLLTRQQVPEYYNDGYFTEAGKQFVEMTLAAIVLRPAALQAAQTDGVVSLRKAIVNALPVLMDNIALHTPGAALVEAINEAVVFQQKMKASKLSFADFLAQKNLLDTVSYSCEMLTLNRLMNTGQRAFKTTIARYNETLKANTGESLFGESQKVSPSEAFEKIILESLDGSEKRLVQQYCSNLERESTELGTPNANINQETVFERKITEAFEAGKKLNVTNLRKLAKEAGIEAGNEKYLWELTELAWTKWYRQLATFEGPPARKFHAVTVFYENVQPTYTGVDSHKKVFQQYSTSAPIAWLAGWFTDTGNVASVLEPSAGNGLLTIYYPEEIVVANDLDPVRYQNLLKQAFRQVLNRDASEPFPADFHRAFDAVLTNPPFGRLPDVNREFGLPFKAIDHVMVAHALDCMKDDGRAGLIIGGHTQLTRDGQIASHRPFFNWLYRHYRVLAMLNVNAAKLYHKQGTDFPLRLILIVGRKAEPYGSAPMAGNPALGIPPIDSFGELYRAVDFFRRKADEREETLTQKINREYEKVKIELA